MLERLTIATRESALAMWQAQHIRERISILYPGCRVALLPMTTRGDQILDKSLSSVGGKGLFIKELEMAIAEGRADLAVHSLKDVPMLIPEGFILAAIIAREDARDALVSSNGRTLDELPAGAVVGTSSLRRAAQLRARYRQLTVKSLRGNIGTRLRKLDEGQFDAIILAAAGLIRLGQGARITALFDPTDSLPAPGQGALGIECRIERTDIIAGLAPLHDAETAACVNAERAFSRALGGSCHTPIGAYAQLADGQILLKGLIASSDGKRVLRASAVGAVESAEELGTKLAEQLRARGASQILGDL